MTWKDFLKLTKVKLVLTLVLLVLSELLVYHIGANTVWHFCESEPCPQPNYGPHFILIWFVPLLLIYYLLSCVITEIHKKKFQIS